MTTQSTQTAIAGGIGCGFEVKDDFWIDPGPILDVGPETGERVEPVGVTP